IRLVAGIWLVALLRFWFAAGFVRVLAFRLRRFLVRLVASIWLVALLRFRLAAGLLIRILSGRRSCLVVIARIVGRVRFRVAGLGLIGILAAGFWLACSWFGIRAGRCVT